MPTARGGVCERTPACATAAAASAAAEVSAAPLARSAANRTPSSLRLRIAGSTRRTASAQQAVEWLERDLSSDAEFDRLFVAGNLQEEEPEEPKASGGGALRALDGGQPARATTSVGRKLVEAGAKTPTTLLHKDNKNPTPYSARGKLRSATPMACARWASPRLNHTWQHSYNETML